MYVAVSDFRGFDNMILAGSVAIAIYLYDSLRKAMSANRRNNDTSKNIV